MGVKQIFTILKLWAAFEIFSFSMLFPFIARHFSDKEIVQGFLLLFLAPLPFLYFMKNLKTKGLMLSSFIMRWLCVFIFVLKPTLVTLYGYFILNGLIIFFFWTPYNMRYFIFSNKMNRATSAGHFIVVGPILNSFIPLISGLVISRLGAWAIVAGSSLFLIVLLWKASKLPVLDFSYSFWNAFTKAKGLRTLKFVQGAWEAMLSMTIPLYAITFVKGEIAFGGFLSYLGLIGVIATLIVTRFSDKQHKRMKFLSPLLIFYSFFIFLLFFADNLITWLVFTALLSITQIIIYPFFFAVVLDKIKDKAIGMVIREFMLNAGRVFGVGVIIVLLYIGLPLQFTFLASGIFPLVYLSLLLIKKTYVEEAYYPLSPVVKVYDKNKHLVGKAYSWGKVVTLKEFQPKDVTARVHTGTKWITISLKDLSKQAFNKILKGEVIYLKKLKKRRKNI